MSENGIPTGARASCPACDGPVVELRSKLVCARCRVVVETCCDGGRQGGA